MDSKRFSRARPKMGAVRHISIYLTKYDIRYLIYRVVPFCHSFLGKFTKKPVNN